MSAAEMKRHYRVRILFYIYAGFTWVSAILWMFAGVAFWTPLNPAVTSTDQEMMRGIVLLLFHLLGMITSATLVISWFFENWDY